MKRVADDSGQRVDWFYSGGYASVLFLGDYARVRASVEKLLPELKSEAFRLYEPEAHGLYRAGDELPDGVAAVDNS